ncbi:S-methyl-5-thioribose-1-phosphate isomerase [Candidatus Bathyarchaeota archaeon A05DMB-2]|jgi:ribose 1,5-bisphosphate isomerase|nr:S-methyl-5-thioribose-1-phosphate isomerase [Candidatus Bathyarchaeota archaeon A05DMB-2]
MAEKVRETVDRIRRLEVQGARNVAIAAIKALEALAQETRAKTRENFVKELDEAKTVLFASRETEPLMRNAIKWIITRVEDCDERSVSALASLVSSSSKSFQKKLEASKELIAEIGAKRIRDGSVILTHCHSSTVTRLLSKAKEDGRNFEVICTETRPALQGRITAKELVALGIKTTMIVDSAARAFMNDVDLVIVGADALTSEGNVVNKIGTSAIAVLAYEARKPFYVVSELLKFDAATLCGDYEKIEERSPTEVWMEAPEKLIIRNPAFDVTRREYVHGVICEEGIIPPHSVNEVVQRKYPWIFL